MRIGPRAMPQQMPTRSIGFHVHRQMADKRKSIIVVGDQTGQRMAANQFQRVVRVVELGGQVHGALGEKRLFPLNSHIAKNLFIIKHLRLLKVAV